MIASDALHYNVDGLITELRAAVEALTICRITPGADAQEEAIRWQTIESKENLIAAIEKELLKRCKK